MTTIGGNEMAYTMAYTGPGGPMSRREYRTGSLFQRCEKRYGCPPISNGERPKHQCKGRWFGVLEAGLTASGDRRRITVSAKTKAEAKARLQAKRQEMEREGHRNVRRTITVARWAEQWLDSIRPKVRPSAYEADKAAVAWINRSIGSVKLADLSPADVRAVAGKLRTEGRSTSTALRYHGALLRMLKAASLDGYAIPPNVLLAENPTKAVNDRAAIPLPDAIKILGHVSDPAKVPDGSRWALAMLQGIRQAEALGLTWDAVDLDAGTLTISWQSKSLRYLDADDHGKGFAVPDGYEVRHLIGSAHLVRPKSAAGHRVIPLIGWAVNALRDWQQRAPENPHGLVWPGPERRGGYWPRNPASDREQWVEIQRAVGVQHPSGRPYVVHEARHTTATLLMQLQVPESVRIAIMGHSSIAVTKGYEHVDTRQAREALERAGKMLGLG